MNNHSHYSKIFMLKALALAKKAKGNTSPNPAVGAVLVHNNKIISHGYTQKAGQAHAEVMAIQKLPSIPKNTQLYVTLEPCCQYGQTPPCTNLIIQKQIQTIFIGTLDPNPNVHSQSVSILKKAGLQVQVGFLQDPINQLNEDFTKWIQTQMPFCTAKYAMTLDGKIATPSGDSKWISNSQSRQIVQNLRNQSDSIMVGVNTVIQDNPQLTVRIKNKWKNPLRIILDPQAQTPTQSQVLTDPFPSLFVLKQNPLSQKKQQFLQLCQIHQKSFLFDEELQEKSTVEHNKNPFISLTALFKKLATINICSVFLESGPTLLSNTLQNHLIDKIICFIAPKILGTQGLVPFILKERKNIPISQAFLLKKISSLNVQDDIMITGYVDYYN